MELSGVGSGCTVAQLQESVWKGGSTLGAGKTTPSICLGRNGLTEIGAVFRVGLKGPLKSLAFLCPQVCTCCPVPQRRSAGTEC